MISQFFITNIRGDSIVFKDCKFINALQFIKICIDRGESAQGSITDAYFRYVSRNPKTYSPIFVGHNSI
jgi:hypothetical protein